MSEREQAIVEYVGHFLEFGAWPIRVSTKQALIVEKYCPFLTQKTLKGITDGRPIQIELAKGKKIPDKIAAEYYKAAYLEMREQYNTFYSKIKDVMDIS